VPYRRHPTDHIDGQPRQRSREEWRLDSFRDYRWIREWQRLNDYGDKKAAAKLGLSVSAFRRQRSGRSPVSRQTVMLAIQSILDLPGLLKTCRMIIKMDEMNTLGISDDT
jgi:hypothetical protein